MIEERYCSYEVSKLLYEKDSNIIDISRDYWKIGPDGVMYFMCSIGAYTDNREDIYAFYRPKDSYPCLTQAIAMAWLREKHNIHIEIEAYPHEDGCFYWHYRIMEMVKDNDVFGYFKRMQKAGFDSYEEAVEAALKDSLENLI